MYDWAVWVVGIGRFLLYRMVVVGRVRRVHLY